MPSQHEPEGLTERAGALRSLSAVAGPSPVAPPHKLPAELQHRFRLFVIDWSLFAAAAGGPERARALSLLDALLAAGARVALLAGGSLAEVLAALGDGIRGPHVRRLYVAAGGDTHLYGFSRRGEPAALLHRHATPTSGAIATLFAHVIRPLEISPHDQLVLSATHHDATAERGVAEAVHAEADAARLVEILERQLELDRDVGPFAPPRDAAWVIEERGFDIAREHEIESLLAISNGYLGSRGSIAEGSSVSRPATFLAGAFEPSADVSHVPELVIAPDWGRLRFIIEGEPFSVEDDEVLYHRRNLDMRRGLLLRDCVARSPDGRITALRTLHAASLSRRNVLLEGVRVEPRNFTGTLRVDAVLSGDVRSASGAAHWESFTTEARARCLSLVGRTRGGLVLAMTSHMRVGPDDDSGARREQIAGARSIAERCEIPIRLAEARELSRTTTVRTSRDADAPAAEAEALQIALAERSMAELLAEHERAWADRWRRADVEIDGAPRMERALRFALYHMIGTANPDDPRYSVGARSLTGEAYRGHVFWDTEIFLLPFYAHCYPEAARALVRYRHRTLDGARRKAKSFGYEGALYAWESADTGDETTPSLVVTPFGEAIRILSGEQEHHISADVAYATHAYLRATGDEALARAEGLEILVETARFWASRVEVGGDGLAHIRRIIGPDEYHEEVDDNAFTNWMARRNLRLAAHAVRRGDARADVAERLGVAPGEVERWLDIAGRMYLGVDTSTGLIEQFAGYFKLEPFDIAEYAVRTAPIDVLFGRARTQASQVIKQADVVQLVALLWEELSPAARRDNFLYYEPRTAHGSSLSPGIHALVAARLGLMTRAERYLEQTADVDLGNNMGNAAGGVHIAAMGSLWQAVVLGVAGIRRMAPVDAPPAADGENDAIGIEPHLPPGWRHLRVPFLWRGRALDIRVEPDAVEVGLEGDRALSLCALHAGSPPRRTLAEPGRRYVARRTGLGFGGWEEITS